MVDYKGDDKMQQFAANTLPKLQELFNGMTTEEKLGMVKFIDFWSKNLSAGHKNIFRMAIDIVAAHFKEQNGG
jgi:hypothetical protein